MCSRGVGHNRVPILPLTGSDETALRACETLEQVVAGCGLRSRAVWTPEIEDRSQPNASGGKRRSPGVVRLNGTARDHRIGTRIECGGQMELELADLVPGEPETGEIVPLHPDRRTT
jgi:hypothetical protein